MENAQQIGQTCDDGRDTKCGIFEIAGGGGMTFGDTVVNLTDDCHRLSFEHYY